MKKVNVNCRCNWHLLSISSTCCRCSSTQLLFYKENYAQPYQHTQLEVRRNFYPTVSTCRQFHQRFTCTFFVWKSFRQLFLLECNCQKDVHKKNARIKRWWNWHLCASKKSVNLLAQKLLIKHWCNWYLVDDGRGRRHVATGVAVVRQRPRAAHHLQRVVRVMTWV